MSLSILGICKRAQAASHEVAKLSGEVKNTALCRMANALEANAEKILEANKLDVQAAKAKGLKAALMDRLSLDNKKIVNMAKCLREVSSLPDPIGAIEKTWTRPNGLVIGQLRVPLGVVGVIYESRPDVTSDSAGICIKSGNAVILRGGSDAINIKHYHRKRFARCTNWFWCSFRCNSSRCLTRPNIRRATNENETIH